VHRVAARGLAKVLAPVDTDGAPDEKKVIYSQVSDCGRPRNPLL